MDYLDESMIKTYNSADEFFSQKKSERIILMTTKAKKKYSDFKFKKNDTLLFGRESAGVPEKIPGAFFVSVAPCGQTAIVLCSAYNVNPENIIKALFISTFASMGTIFFAIKYLTLQDLEMSKRYSGKSFKDASVMKKAKLSFKEKRKIKREKKNKK